MTVRVGINGFGRIGRCVFRAAMDRPDIEIVAINDLTDAKTLAHLLKYDSVHGNLSANIEVTGDGISVNGKAVKIVAERDPAALPWKELNVDMVVESTGLFTARDDAAKHLSAGARKVIISAPAKQPDLTMVLGVNDTAYNADTHHIVSNASCTTNCLAPVAKVVHDSFGIVHGLVTTVHAYTNDQRLLDLPHSDMRRARAAAISMIPTTTGAARAVAEVLPELAGKLDGMAIRVPTPNVSVVDAVFTVEQETTAEAVNEALKAAASGPMKGFLQVCDEPLVSIDFCGDPHSSSVDSALTKVIAGRMVKIISWYDNEWGYSSRVVDLMTRL
ncbi:MAG: type I glyceraldehyde-3-phosphate dehydrogenase [Leptospirillia bacterium]